jgi:N-acetylglucosaminyldiphosphoundecaprenol N-acetyl-beta-D-mannosaminyltransferase
MDIYKTDFFGIGLNLLSVQESLNHIRTLFNSQKKTVFYFLNAHCFNIACKDIDYYQILREADYVFNDGIGIKLAAKLKKIHIPANLNGTDLIPKIIHLAHDLNHSIYLIGGKPGVSENAAFSLRIKHPGLLVVGCTHGYHTENEWNAILKDIREKNPQLIIVGMGVPLQEKWINSHFQEFPGNSIIIAGGAILDFISGTIPRAPHWMQIIGMEWLFRLVMEPKRLWKRYLIGNFLFAINILRTHLKQKKTRNLSV